MKRGQSFLTRVIALIICGACANAEAPRNGKEGERATVEQELGAEQRCRVHYGTVDHEALCDEIGSVMLSYLHIPTSVLIVVKPTRAAKYDEVGRLLKSLQNSGYLIEFPSH